MKVRDDIGLRTGGNTCPFQWMGRTALVESPKARLRQSSPPTLYSTLGSTPGIGKVNILP